MLKHTDRWFRNIGAQGFPTLQVGDSRLIHADCFEWLRSIPAESIHAIVTDPPYGLKEFESTEITRLRNGNKGGIWRIPPAFDGHTRSPLPRFTALNAKEREKLRQFFVDWAALTVRVLRPGGHVFLASNAFLSQLVFEAVVEGGLEFRGQVLRLVRTLRGGDRPKGAEAEFPGVGSLPKGCYEPWGLFRKAVPERMTVGECLRVYQTGGLRRGRDGKPFADVIASERTPQRERKIAPHPSLKPQSLMRQLVHASLPLGEGIVCDPFMGGGSTIAACVAEGIQGIGVERDETYFSQAAAAIPGLAGLKVDVHVHDEELLLDLA